MSASLKQERGIVLLVYAPLFNSGTNSISRTSSPYANKEGQGKMFFTASHFDMN